MNITQINTLDIRNTLTGLIGEVTAKRLFIGYGLFQKQHMFALYKSGNIYLRAKQELAKELEKQGAVSWGVYHPNTRLSVSDYYRLPKAITEDPALYKYFLLQSLEQIEQEKNDTQKRKKKMIRNMANLSVRSERLLSKVGVFTVNDFRTLGAVNCYVRLVKQDLVFGLEFFWKLCAALQHRRVETLTKAEKEELLKSLNCALANAGMKSIK
ncbi:MAG: TfoX/Sxy family DNA transformation protein [Lonepinella koalarum]|nr:TfoX/Sxy family DNA transformation protein [Lonepinella koalarum]